MREQKIYSLNLSIGTLFFFLGAVVIPILMCAFFFFTAPSDKEIIIMRIVFVLGVINLGYYLATVPYKIIWGDQIIFRSLLHDVFILPSEILSITTMAGNPYLLKIKTAHKSILLLNMFAGFHEFFLNLQKDNPAIKIQNL